MLTIYIRNKYISKINNKDTFLASFVAPGDKRDNPYIRIDIENHKDKNYIADINGFRESILISIAHEIVHYGQWTHDLEFCEKEAEDKSDKLVEQFIEDRGHNLTVTFKSKQLLELAESKVECGDFCEAILLYEDVISKGSRDEEIYNSIAYYYDCIEEYDKSLVYYNKALKINPKNSIAYMNKGYALYCKDKYDEAIENYNKSIDIEPIKEAYVFKAYSQEELKNYNGALESYNKAIELDDNYDIAYNRKGQLLCYMGMLNSASESCSKAISISNDYADAYYNLSVILAKMGDFNESANYLKVAISIDKVYIQYAKAEEALQENS